MNNEDDVKIVRERSFRQKLKGDTDALLLLILGMSILIFFLTGCAIIYEFSVNESMSTSVAPLLMQSIVLNSLAFCLTIYKFVQVVNDVNEKD